MPTAVVRDGGAPDGAVVVGVDGSPASAAAVGFAFAEASRRNVAVVAAHAWHVAVPVGPAETVAVQGHHDDRAAHADRLLEDVLAFPRRQHPDVPVDARAVRSPAAATALLELAQHAALVVVGSSGRGHLSGALLGSTSQSVLRIAPCTVVITGPETAVGD